MALTPHEERTIQQIEDSLAATDPGFVERMNGLLRRRRGLLVAGLCLIAITLGVVLTAGSSGPKAVPYCASVAMLAAGWCLGRSGCLSVRSVVAKILNAISYVARSAYRSLSGSH